MSLTLSSARTAEVVSPSGIITDVCKEKLGERIPVAGTIADLLVSGTSLVMYTPEKPGQDEITDSICIECAGIPGSTEEKYTVQIGWSLAAGAGVILESYVATPDALTESASGMPCADPESVLQRIQGTAKAAGGLIIALSK